MRALGFALLGLGLVAQGARAEPQAAPAGAALSPDHKVAYRAQSMGTVVDLTLWTDDEAAAAKAATAVFAEFDRLDKLMSPWVETSDVSRINAAAGGKAVVVSDETLTVVKQSLMVARQSKGAFDITVGAFHGVWKFDEDKDGTLPTAAEVAAKLKLVNYRDVVVDARKKTVRLKRAGMAITLGGIAKGYAVDRGVKILRDAGFVDFIVQAGGDLYVAGKKGATAWRVGIRDPRGSRDTSFAITEIQDKAFSTSGDYERSVVKDGVRYHHILDPKTGYPAMLSRSVTLLAPDAFTADTWDTTLFIMGPDKGLAQVARLKGLEAVFVDAKNQVRLSKGLELVTGDIKAALAKGLAGKILLLAQPTDGV